MLSILNIVAFLSLVFGIVGFISYSSGPIVNIVLAFSVLYGGVVGYATFRWMEKVLEKLDIIANKVTKPDSAETSHDT